MNEPTLAVIFGNRGFFPGHLVKEARKDILTVFQECHINPVMLGESETQFGSIVNFEHAKICAELFRSKRESIVGILVVLPNFGDEKGIADTIKLSGLSVPILIQAYPDEINEFNVELRRDAFCGKISLCNNLRQYGLQYTVTEQHTSKPLSDSFKNDLQKFLAVCNVVKGLRNARIGAIGARPNAFNTVRFSEKILQEHSITVVSADLSELLGVANSLTADDFEVKDSLECITNYIPTNGVPSDSLVKMAKFKVALDRWMADQDVKTTALQCWDSIQKNYGINVCTLMSIMSDRLVPSACEVDVTGAISMYALQLASNQPSALVDWNNNYAENPDKCVLFHCGNWAKSLYPDAKMSYSDILAKTFNKENCFGTITGRIPSGPMSFARISTDDQRGAIRTYTGEGQFTDDPLTTFGSSAVVVIPNLQKLLKFIVMNGFEHHAAISGSYSADILTEAFDTYLGWDVYHHS